MQVDAAARSTHQFNNRGQNQQIKEHQKTEASNEQRDLMKVKLTKEELKELSKDLNNMMDVLSVQARFSVHDKTNEIMISIVNVETGELIRQIPPKKILDMVAKMMEMAGVFVDEKV